MTGENEKERNSCKFKLFDYRCYRPLYDNKHCIFHSKDVEGKQDKFAEAFWKEFERQKAQKKYNFTGFFFPPEFSFHESNFQGTNLVEADLRGANLLGANLLGANLMGANLTGANLMGVDLMGAYFMDADIMDANLMGADLIGAYLVGANLTKAILIGANLTVAILIGANLTGAYLRGANLTEANLAKASLRGANLTKALLIDALNLKVELLLEARTLYQVKGLPPKMEKELKEIKPELFQPPK